MDPFNFADAILCILAQRLLRVLCPDCKAPYHPDRTEYDRLVQSTARHRLLPISIFPIPTISPSIAGPGALAATMSVTTGGMAITELLMGSDTIKRANSDPRAGGIQFVETPLPTG